MTTIENNSATSDSDFVPSHIMNGDYVTLMETNGKECESWIYFIRVEGNMENLRHLQSQLENVDWHILDDLSTFDLDLKHYVSAKTAKEMTKIELNSYSFHRKFDGKLDRIDLEFKHMDTNEDKICKAFDLLGYGQIEDYIDDEDLDEEDLTDIDTEESDAEESDAEDDTEESDEEKKHTIYKIPPACNVERS
jgi:hypothetical protein